LKKDKEKKRTQQLRFILSNATVLLLAASNVACELS